MFTGPSIRRYCCIQASAKDQGSKFWSCRHGNAMGTRCEKFRSRQYRASVCMHDLPCVECCKLCSKIPNLYIALSKTQTLASPAGPGPSASKLVAALGNGAWSSVGMIIQAIHSFCRFLGFYRPRFQVQQLHAKHQNQKRTLKPPTQCFILELYYTSRSRALKSENCPIIPQAG